MDEHVVWKEGCQRILLQTWARLKGIKQGYVDSSTEDLAQLRDILDKRADAEGRAVVDLDHGSLLLGRPKTKGSQDA